MITSKPFFSLKKGKVKMSGMQYIIHFSFVNPVKIWKF